MSEAAEVGQVKRGLSRSVVPRALNALMWLVFCGMAGPGLLLAFRLPPGSRGGARLTALGWVRHDWGDVHTWFSYVFLALIAAQLGEARVAAGGGDRRSAGLVLMNDVPGVATGGETRGARRRAGQGSSVGASPLQTRRSYGWAGRGSISPLARRVW